MPLAGPRADDVTVTGLQSAPSHIISTRLLWINVQRGPNSIKELDIVRMREGRSCRDPYTNE